ncbi:hypothetical protein [Arcobacter sp. FWKO B]|uniref:hypothetical protein n=1 Tax=Arcobacter sp. FWKO B TaxID=2593672 RepID=UPI0018A43CA6|nr:hypothetical protein [Arcobacter sp. FWKO B]QOG11536.1 hypothetical protein FWKOB_01975 [Arcobacter sp. FWKO B]
MSGLIIFPIFIVYVGVGVLILNFILKLFKKQIAKVWIILIVVVFPFWDVIAGYGILGIIKLTAKPTIYEYPQRDEDGRIESVGESLTRGFVSTETLSDSQRLNNFKKKFNNKISDFIEFNSDVYDEDNKRLIVKINFKQNDKPYEIIEQSQARYIGKFITDVEDTTFLGFGIDKSIVEIHDTKENKIIAIAPTIGVSTNLYMEWVRQKIFFLVSSGGGRAMIYIDSIVTAQELRKELFTDIKGIR